MAAKIIVFIFFIFFSFKSTSNELIEILDNSTITLTNLRHEKNHSKIHFTHTFDTDLELSISKKSSPKCHFDTHR